MNRVVKPTYRLCFENKLYFCLALNALKLILATCILFLALKPGMDTLLWQEQCDQTCCSTPCSGDDDTNDIQGAEQGNHCEGKSCNPFQVCSSCVLVCMHIPYHFAPKPAMLYAYRCTYTVLCCNLFVSDVWQPPKIV